MRPRPLIAALLALAALAPAPAAQRGDALAAAPPTLGVHHGFPLAGGELALVVDGLEPGGPVQVRLFDALAAPPSLVEHPLLLVEVDTTDPDRVAVGRADAQGRLSLRVPLDHPDDAGHLVKLRFTDLTTGAVGDAQLLVQPPMALLPTEGGLARVELLNGMPLVPSVPVDGGEVLGAALSHDGLRFHALLDGGALQERSAHTWNAPLLSERLVDPRGDDLATSADTGPMFVVVRPEGDPFAPRGHLVSFDASLPVLELDPLGRRVDGRRWALSDDGLTAWVAEDDLIVREIDLLTWTARTPFVAGFNGDESVADLALVGDRLMVVTRRSGGRPGSLTVLDLTTGAVTPHALTFDPEALVAVDDTTALVLPADGSVVQVVEGGFPVRLDAAGLPGSRVLDGAAVPDGALLLVAGPDGSRALLSWTAAFGPLPLLLDGPVPAAEALVSAGHDLALLVGAPDGQVHRVVPSRGHVEVVTGVTARPGASGMLLP